MKKASLVVKAIIIAALVVLITIFSFQNVAKTPINFLNLEALEIPLFLIIFGVLLLGIIIGYLSGLISGSKIAQRKLDNLKLEANEQAALVAQEITAEKIAKKEPEPEALNN
ncbi:MAG: lipopolysaccharide assembly protein LapA domain-containing protein [Chitinophagales bacterium]